MPGIRESTVARLDTQWLFKQQRKIFANAVVHERPRSYRPDSPSDKAAS